MSLNYVVKRILLFFLIVWVGITITFFLPRLAPGRDPIGERMGMLAASGGVNLDAIEEMIEAYRAKFGLDQPLWKQYLNYLADIARLDFGYSLAMYPSRVLDLIALALPWTIGLLVVSILMAFTLGTLFGGLMAWPKTSRYLQYLVSPFLVLSAIPYYLLGLILIYLLAFQFKIFPLGGGSQYGVLPSLTWGYMLDVLYHSILPAFSIVLASMGFWALGMRGMMVTVLGEDYVTLAQARGLRGGRIFFWYGLRNALLPQTTSLALSLGTILSGALLVEVIYRYPGMGSLLFRAIAAFDYFTIYGIVFFIVVTIGLATVILDLIYPLLDPRITYQKN
jgi:peptide/nickel transport system permease protein